MAAYGFVAGLPLPLSGFTFRLWLSEGGVSLALIGVTANIGLAYSLKFLWAPVLDNAPPPGPLRWLGRRRGWLAAIQPALAGAAALLALSDPARLPLVSLGIAAMVAFLSASQDIVVDAWRIEVFPEHRQGAAMAAYVWGYRVALLIATTGVISAVGTVAPVGPLGLVRAVLAAGRRRGLAGRSRGGRQVGRLEDHHRGLEGGDGHGGRRPGRGGRPGRGHGRRHDHRRHAPGRRRRPGRRGGGRCRPAVRRAVPGIP